MECFKLGMKHSTMKWNDYVILCLNYTVYPSIKVNNHWKCEQTCSSMFPSFYPDNTRPKFSVEALQICFLTMFNIKQVHKLYEYVQYMPFNVYEDCKLPTVINVGFCVTVICFLVKLHIFVSSMCH